MSGVPPVNPRSCPTNATVPVKIFQYDRDPTSADFRNFKIRDFWANQVDNTLWYCIAVSASGATWIPLGAGTTNLEKIAGNTGGDVGPDASYVINLVGSGPISVTGNPGTNTLTIEDDGTYSTQFDGDSGSATPAANILNIVGSGGLQTSATGNTVTVEGDGSIATQYDGDTGSATPAAGVLDILGGTGCSTTATGNSVTVDVDATVATSYDTDDGTATPSSNNLDVVGGAGMRTSGTSNIITAYSESNSVHWNIGWSISGGTVTIHSASGAALSATNPGWIRLATNGASGFTWYKLTANVTLDDAQLDGNPFGTTTGVAWASNYPLFLYVAADSSNTTLAFFVSGTCVRNNVPTTAAQVGTPGSPVTSSPERGTWACFSSITVGDYTGSFCERLFVIDATKDSSDNWTFTAVNSLDAVSSYLYTFPTGQLGAAANSYFNPNGGTAPTVNTGTSYCYYRPLSANGSTWQITYLMEFNGNGVGSVNAQLTYPVPSADGSIFIASGIKNSGGSIYSLQVNTFNDTTLLLFEIGAPATLTQNTYYLLGDIVTVGYVYVRESFPV